MRQNKRGKCETQGKLGGGSVSKREDKAGGQEKENALEREAKPPTLREAYHMRERQTTCKVKQYKGKVCQREVQHEIERDSTRKREKRHKKK